MATNKAGAPLPTMPSRAASPLLQLLPLLLSGPDCNPSHGLVDTVVLQRCVGLEFLYGLSERAI